ncbi:MAG: hypothetical protein AB7F88_00305 [Pyrinomonadaceae bacterium]
MIARCIVKFLLRGVTLIAAVMFGVFHADHGFARSAEIFEKSEVFVLGTLYNRHRTVDAYGVESLRKTIEKINPQVLVLDVNQTELKEQKVSLGKVEYPGAIFPFLNERKLPAYPGEPPDPMFSEIVNIVADLRKDFERTDPERFAAMKRFRAATYEALSQFWKSPADVNGSATEKVILGLKAYEAVLLGPKEKESHERWDAYAVEMTLQAARENSGKRILQITGIENCPRIRAGLNDSGKVRLVEMESWIRRN